MSRRTLLGSGLTVGAAAGAVVVARATGVLDDVLRGLGAEPRPEPDPGDTRRLARAATDQAALVAAIAATSAEHDRFADGLTLLRVVAEEQLTAVGGGTPAADATVPDDGEEAAAALTRAATKAAEVREDDAVAAVSPEVARVLASMSAGLSQLARQLGRTSE